MISEDGIIIKLTIICANKLVKKDIFRLPDPFVGISLNDGSNTKFKTEIKKDTLDPIWNQSYDFCMTSRGLLKLVVMDQKKLYKKKYGSSLLGSIQLSFIEVLDLIESGTAPIPLQDPSENIKNNTNNNNNSQIKGYLILNICPKNVFPDLSKQRISYKSNLLQNKLEANNIKLPPCVSSSLLNNVKGGQNNHLSATNKTKVDHNSNISNNQIYDTNSENRIDLNKIENRRNRNDSDNVDSTNKHYNHDADIVRTNRNMNYRSNSFKSKNVRFFVDGREKYIGEDSNCPIYATPMKNKTSSSRNNNNSDDNIDNNINNALKVNNNDIYNLKINSNNIDNSKVNEGNNKDNIFRTSTSGTNYLLDVNFKDILPYHDVDTSEYPIRILI